MFFSSEVFAAEALVAAFTPHWRNSYSNDQATRCQMWKINRKTHKRELTVSHLYQKYYESVSLKGVNVNTFCFHWNYRQSSPGICHFNFNFEMSLGTCLTLNQANYWKEANITCGWYLRRNRNGRLKHLGQRSLLWQPRCDGRRWRLY